MSEFKLKEILKEALKFSTHSWECAIDFENESVDESNCDCWVGKAREALITKAPQELGGFARWDGEKCGQAGCGHSSTYHSGGGVGLCTKESCTECFKFVPTGIANTQAR